MARAGKVVAGDQGHPQSSILARAQGKLVRARAHCCIAILLPLRFNCNDGDGDSSRLQEDLDVHAVHQSDAGADSVPLALWQSDCPHLEHLHCCNTVFVVSLWCSDWICFVQHTNRENDVMCSADIRGIKNFRGAVA